MSTRSRPFFILLAVLGLVLGLAGTALAAPEEGEQGVWIVTLHEEHDASTNARLVARSHGGEARFVYDDVLNGFSFHGSERGAANLERDPRVRTVVEDRPVHAVGETMPTGVNRIDAEPSEEPSTGNGTSVAVLDTGVDASHEDLGDRVDTNLGKNCYDDTSSDTSDGHGHGTHVSGTVAATAGNGLGVIGVAPEVAIVPVKVLSDSGSGSWETVICGVDHVTGLNTDSDGNLQSSVIDVANMSLGGSGDAGSCTDGGLRQAICESVNNAQIAYSVAAGNDSKDASGFVPAAYPEVITVSALADFDGTGGGSGGCYIFAGMGKQCDDDFAKFSNYGSIVDVIAPGVLINSTLPGNEYGDKSGTSMAAPHVAGVAALVRAADSSLLPHEVEALLRDTGECPDGNENSGAGDCSNQGQWENDPDGIAEPLVNAPRAVTAAASGDSGPSVSITNPSDGAEVSGSETVAADATDDDGVDQVEFSIDGSSVATDTDGGDGWSFDWDTTGYDDGSHTVTATATDTAGQTASDSITVTVDNVDDPPSVSITDPADGATVSGTVSVTAEATDDDGVDQVEFSIDGSSVATDTDGGDGWSFDWDTTGYDDGSSHTVTATATDTAGQTASDSVSVTVDNSGIALSATGYKVKGRWTTDLSWSGTNLDGEQDVTVYWSTDGTSFDSYGTADDGEDTHSTDIVGGGSLTYYVCEADSGSCSDQVTVTF